MSAERKTSEFNTEYPLYSGLYKSLIQYIDIDDIVSPKRPAISPSSVAAFSESLIRCGFLRPVYLSRDGGRQEKIRRRARTRRKTDPVRRQSDASRFRGRSSDTQAAYRARDFFRERGRAFRSDPFLPIFTGGGRRRARAESIVRRQQAPSARLHGGRKIPYSEICTQRAALPRAVEAQRSVGTARGDRSCRLSLNVGRRRRGIRFITRRVGRIARGREAAARDRFASRLILGEDRSVFVLDRRPRRDDSFHDKDTAMNSVSRETFFDKTEVFHVKHFADM